MNKFTYGVAVATLFAIFGSFVTVGYWLTADDLPTISLEPEPTSIPHEVKPGEEVLVSWNAKLFRACPATLYQSIVGNGITLPVTAVKTMIPDGHVAKVGVIFAMPSIIMPGDYELRVTGYFHCNPVGSVEVIFPNGHVRVVKP